MFCYVTLLIYIHSFSALLLVIFAYHGGHGVGSWFYSLLVVVSGLAFVVFGPLLLCRFLMHAYYRQVEARSTIRLQVRIKKTVRSGFIPNLGMSGTFLPSWKTWASQGTFVITTI